MKNLYEVSKLYVQAVDFDASGNPFLIVSFENGEEYRFPFGTTDPTDVEKCVEKYKMSRRKEKINKILSGR